MMKRNRSSTLVALAVLSAWACFGTFFSQAQTDIPPVGDAAAADQDSPLGVRQQRIKRMLVDLERKFTELASKLREEQPEQADKLEEAFKRSKEFLLMQRMDEVTLLLNQAKLESADDEQTAIIDDLKALIDLLLYEEDAFEKLMNEIEQLEAWKAQLDQLIAREEELKEESETLADREGALEKLEARIAEAKELIARQEALKEASASGEIRDVDDLDRMADEQTQLRQDTDAFAESLASGKDPREDAEEGEGSKSESTASRAEKRAAESVGEAAKDQKNAEKELGAGQPEPASRAQQDALADLGRALETLEAERDRVAGLTPDASGELAGQQSRTAEETGQLGSQMSEAAEPMEGAGQNVEQARGEMEGASENLAKNQPGSAAGQQSRAAEALRKAREAVEERLNERRDEAQKEQLARLGEVFQRMLEAQRKVNGGVVDLAERRGGDEKRLARLDRITLRNLAQDQRKLEADAEHAETLLVDDGTSIVFRDVVGYLRNEMGFTAERMEDQQTGTVVQESQREIEATLLELIAALENAQNQQQMPPDPAQAQQGGQRQQSLFPPLAELKLLKSTQERINRQTLNYDRLRVEEPVERLNRQFEGMVDMQEKLTSMARQLASKLTPPADPTEID